MGELKDVPLGTMREEGREGGREKEREEDRKEERERGTKGGREFNHLVKASATFHKT